MRKIMMLLFIFGLIVGSLLGCASNDDKQVPNQSEDKITKRVTLYFADSGNENFVTEEHEITYSKDEDMYKVVVEELIKGPNNDQYRSNLSKETTVLETTRQNSDIIVNFGEQFQFSGSMAEILGIGSIVNTLTALEGIERVKILVKGEEFIGPSGEPRGFMEPFINNEVPEPQSQEVTLYFGNQDGTAVAAEKRTIVLAPNTTREELFRSVLEELIKGPKSTILYKTIPIEVKVKSVELNDDILSVDFSQEMHTNHWGGATGEAMTINSIVNTLTEFNDVNKVKMTVEGQPMSIEHSILEEPLGRNEDMIQK